MHTNIGRRLQQPAPVLQGTGDAILSEAVGHDPGSAWPGQPGTIVLSAHDVTWFSSIGSLRPGDVLQYVTPCRTYSYQVTGHNIVRAGSPVYTTAASRIVLDTCYPFNALYLTNSRYLVYADLTIARPTHPLTAPPVQPPPPRVPAPARRFSAGQKMRAVGAKLAQVTQREQGCARRLGRCGRKLALFFRTVQGCSRRR